MRKLLLFGLLVLAVVLVTSCAPLPENEGSSVITDPDQIESNTGALAGQAINAGCRSSNVVSCVSEANDISGTIKKSNGQVVNFRFTNGCRANDQVVTYKCTKPTQYQYCTTPCQAGQQCERGQCVVQCSDSDPQDDPTVMGTVTNSLGGVGGPVLLPQSDNCAPDGQLSQVECGPNRVISHTFSTCPDGQVCQNGACAAPAPCVPVAATACTAGVGCPGNTVIPALGCQAGQVCTNGACAQPVLPANGAPCVRSAECASGFCNRSNLCQDPYSLGSRCNFDRECASGICGRNEQDQGVCEEPNQPAGSPCRGDQECASHLCLMDNPNRAVCGQSNQTLGSPCRYGLECVSLACRNETSINGTGPVNNGACT